jgi:hypothetical protein
MNQGAAVLVSGAFIVDAVIGVIGVKSFKRTQIEYSGDY